VSCVSKAAFASTLYQLVSLFNHDLLDATPRFPLNPHPLDPLSPSPDIRNTYGSWVANAQTVAPYASAGFSGPTCWAYPDMLMVGVIGGSCSGDECAAASVPLPTLVEQRTHFGLWCILSSPLTLSLDLTNATTVDAIWPIITNVDAIGVDQAWAGSHGGVFAAAAVNVTLQHCTPEWDGDQNCTLPVSQSWFKPLTGGGAAVFVANHGPNPLPVVITFAAVPGLGCSTCDVYDVWGQASIGSHAGSYSVPALASHDSVFVVLQDVVSAASG
jgi:alpha-galactosidase